MLKKLLILGCLWGFLGGSGLAQINPGPVTPGGTGVANAVKTQTGAPTSCTYSSSKDPVRIYSGTLYVCSVGGTYVALATGTTVSFAGLTGGTNTTAAMVVGSGASFSCASGSTCTFLTQTQNNNSTAPATTAYTDLAVSNGIAGVNPAIAVLVATTAAADTSGLTYNNGVSGVGATFTGAVNTAITIDGVTFTAVGQRLLVKNDTQSPSGAFNGIYSLTALQTAGTGAIFTRASDYNSPSDMNNTGAIPVQSGTVNATTSWLMTAQIVTVGTTPLTFAQFSYAPSTIPTLAANNVFTGNNSFANGDFTVGSTAHTLLAGANGLVDLSAETGANGLKIPVQAGATPTANGAASYNSTQGTYTVGVSTVGGASVSATMTHPLVFCATTNTATGDALVNTSISTNETAFSTTCTIPANLIILGKNLHVRALGYNTESGTPVNITYRIRLTNNVGTAIMQLGTTAVANNDPWMMDINLSGTAGVGSSVNVSVNGFGYENNAIIPDALGASPTAMATNGAIVLVVTVKYSAATATNTSYLTSIYGEAIN